MSESEESQIRQEKKSLRKLAGARLASQRDLAGASQAIHVKLESLDAFRSAACVMCYVSMRNEVQTKEELIPRWIGHKKIVVPYVERGELGLFWLERLDELVAGTWGILEPDAILRRTPQKQVDPSELDCIVVPGVAFDRQGGRLGHGKGYYDRLLERVSPETFLVAIAFECQIFDKIPCQSHDVTMDCIVTEHACYHSPSSASRIH